MRKRTSTTGRLAQFLFAMKSVSNPDGRLMTPEGLGYLRSLAQLPDHNITDRLSVPKRNAHTPVRRHTRIIRGAEMLPPMQRPPEPSESLRGHTISEAMRLFPDMRHERLSFAPSVSRLDLPLQASASQGRMGDEVHLSRMRSNFRRSLHTSGSLRQTSSASSLMLRSQTSSAIEPARRGRAMMLSGGAPLPLKSQESLARLQLRLLGSFAAPSAAELEPLPFMP